MLTNIKFCRTFRDTSWQEVKNIWPEVMKTLYGKHMYLPPEWMSYFTVTPSQYYSCSWYSLKDHKLTASNYCQHNTLAKDQGGKQPWNEFILVIKSDGPKSHDTWRLELEDKSIKLKLWTTDNRLLNHNQIKTSRYLKKCIQITTKILRPPIAWTTLHLR